MTTQPRKVSTGATVIICTDLAAKRGTPEHERIAQAQCRAAYNILVAVAREREAQKRAIVSAKYQEEG